MSAETEDATDAAAAREAGLSGQRKAAILVLALGDELARTVFQELRPSEVEKILAEAEALEGVTAREVKSVLAEFHSLYEDRVLGVTGHQYRLQQAATATLGRRMVAGMLQPGRSHVNESLDERAQRDPAGFSQALSKEQPQVIAVVLAMLTPAAGAAVLDQLPVELQSDIMQRLSKLSSLPVETLQQVAEAFGQQLGPRGAPGASAPVNLDGIGQATELVKALGGAEDAKVLAQMRVDDPELAEKIEEQLFVFEDLLALSGREIQLVLREIDRPTLALAMKTASGELKAAVMANMSTRAGRLLMDEIDVLGPTPLKQVEEAQQQVLHRVLSLAQEGKVNLNTGNLV